MAKASTLSRTYAAFRLQFLTPNLVIVPGIVFVFGWAVALGIFFWVDGVATDRDPVAEPMFAGGSQAPLWCLAFMAAYVGSHTFPFSQALSFSRKVFLAGTLAAFAAVSVGFGVAFVLAAWTEELTNGFGIHGYNFAIPYLTSQGLGVTGFVAAAACWFVMLLGFTIVMLYKRLGLTNTWLVIIAVIVVILAAVLLTVTNVGWSGLWGWFGGLTPMALLGWLMVPAVVLTLASYALIRRASPV
ncbi:hypothetical protein [Sediminivirga luteola]|uniref:Uncharacterized protein n=1 Tax=Sediminivirga luteola TaxID=1774748 RepID=A0A8J2TVZ8_9MICO|nr:hypothetical protein [Sediminivirga luteola]GGA06246.1 hypothetical protein GCM10011333_06500 [Sediminivirga luteola]